VLLYERMRADLELIRDELRGICSDLSPEDEHDLTSQLQGAGKYLGNAAAGGTGLIRS